MLTLVGLQPDDPLLQSLQLLHPFFEMEGRCKTKALLSQGLGKIFGQNLPVSGRVVDELVRVEDRELAAYIGESLDDLGSHLPHPCVEGAEEARRPSPDDGDVEDVPFVPYCITSHSSAHRVSRGGLGAAADYAIGGRGCPRGIQPSGRELLGASRG